VQLLPAALGPGTAWPRASHGLNPGGAGELFVGAEGARSHQPRSPAVGVQGILGYALRAGAMAKGWGCTLGWSHAADGWRQGWREGRMDRGKNGWRDGWRERRQWRDPGEQQQSRVALGPQLRQTAWGQQSINKSIYLQKNNTRKKKQQETNLPLLLSSLNTRPRTSTSPGRHASGTAVWLPSSPSPR